MIVPLILFSATRGADDASTQITSKGGALHMFGLTGVTEHLTAKHTDLILNEGTHEHTWAVTAYYPSEPFRDGRSLKAALRALLDALPGPDGVLPPELWAGEAIARRVLLLANVVGVSVKRPEGFEAWACCSS